MQDLLNRMIQSISDHTGAINPGGVLDNASAFIFDMDDLLVRSQSIWHGALSSLLRGSGISAEFAGKLNYRGLSAADTAKMFHHGLGVSDDLEAFQATFVEHLLNEINRKPVIALPGAVSALRRASEHGPVAVASGSPLDVIHSVLGQLGVIDNIKIILSSDEVPLGKPEPDVFLEAARMLKEDPSDCVVFEDSYVGVKAAIAANIPCFAVPSETPEAIGQLTPFTFDSLDDIPWG